MNSKPNQVNLALLPNLFKAILIAGGLYIVLGATWTGVAGATYAPALDYRNQAIAALAFVTIVWLALRLILRLPWHWTTLDWSMPLWALAFGVSLLANSDTWRRSAIGLWFVGVYLVIWYLFSDLMSNRKLPRAVVVDGFLLSVLPIIWSCFDELSRWYTTQGRSILQNSGLGAFIDELPRIKSTLDNPNTLATILLMVWLLAMGRILSVRQWWVRILLAVYVVVTGTLLFITQSRGAWLGAGVGLTVGGWLMLQHYRIRLSLLVRVLLIGLAVVAGGAVSFARGWSDEGRSVIYGAAISMFRDKPLTGYGLYTFGQQLITRVGVLPAEVPHAHAHNIILHVAAELGLLGLIATATTVGLVFVAVRRSWRVLDVPKSDATEQADQNAERILIIAGTAAMIGFGIHHLFDVTASQPAVAACGMLPLIIAAVPAAPKPVAKRAQSFFRFGLAALVSVALVGFGWWDNHVFSEFRDVINYFYQHSNEPATAEARLHVVMDEDPRVPIYVLTRSFMLHRMGDRGAAQAVFNQFCALEPYFDARKYSDPQFVVTQMSILQFLRFSPLAHDRDYWSIYKCP